MPIYLRLIPKPTIATSAYLNQPLRTQKQAFKQYIHNAPNERLKLGSIESRTQCERINRIRLYTRTMSNAKPSPKLVKQFNPPI
ncbi:hypothetical protein LCGC14_2844780 [marine sediment metagenome]|uniref:Uncharacterized protein n=1 Tax=marine sediment metagenome TaxID=412755 RepID=A0A0F9B170_9ZZZZ